MFQFLSFLDALERRPFNVNKNQLTSDMPFPLNISIDNFTSTAMMTTTTHR